MTRGNGKTEHDDRKHPPAQIYAFENFRNETHNLLDSIKLSWSEEKVLCLDRRFSMPDTKMLFYVIAGICCECCVKVYWDPFRELHYEWKFYDFIDGFDLDTETFFNQPLALSMISTHKSTLVKILLVSLSGRRRIEVDSSSSMRCEIMRSHANDTFLISRCCRELSVEEAAKNSIKSLSIELNGNFFKGCRMTSGC